MTNILVDQQIPLAQELFSPLGTVDTYDYREVTSERIKNTDVLITRSTLTVDMQLLEGSPVKFVGTCTIGKDHLDTTYLEKQGIAWTNAPGCNANAVLQYVLSVMAQLRPRWMQQRIGIIACGSIGRRVYRCLNALGVDCVCYDPFLSADDIPDLTTFENVLQSDIIISNAPLTHTGSFPTHHMIDEVALNTLRENSLLISVGRGAVIDNQALLSRIKSNKNFSVALDVWENEPNISEALLQLVDIATPHIAGYSLEGKENGTHMVYKKLCEFLAVESVVLNIGSQQQQMLNVNYGDSLSDDDILNAILLAVYPVMNDDTRLRQCPTPVNLGQHFDVLRKQYPVRRELPYYLMPETPPAVNEWLNVLLELQ